MPRIFICYRRDDTTELAEELFNALGIVYEEENIFRDEEALTAGTQFKVKITESIVSCDVFLVLVGKNWNPKQLSEEGDFVSFEIQTALKYEKRILVITAEGASPPTDEDLPHELRTLALIQAAPISLRQFKGEFRKLKTAIESLESASDGIFGSYIPRQSSDFIKWLERFLTKSRAHLGQFGIDENFILLLERAKKQLNMADEAVTQESERVANVQAAYEEAEKAAQEARKQLSKAEEKFRACLDERNQAVYRALSEVHPLSEKLRNSGDVADNKKKEFGIFGEYIPIDAHIEAPSGVEVNSDKSEIGLLRRGPRTDIVMWEDTKNPPGTTYVVEAVVGSRDGRGNLYWDADKFEVIERTSEKKATKRWKDNKPCVYRIKSFFRGVESEYCDAVFS